jgi:hypothetical protein
MMTGLNNPALNGVALEAYAGYLNLDFNGSAWSAGYLHGQDDQYGFTYDHEDGTDTNQFVLETNDGSRMLNVYQPNAGGANKSYIIQESGSPKTNWVGANSYRFRALIDSPTSDTGRQIRFIMSDAVAGKYVIWKFLGNGIIQCQVNSNTRINQSGLTAGNITVMGYYNVSTTTFYMKAKNGHDAAMSWSQWDGLDANAFGSYVEANTHNDAKLYIGAGNDTSPCSHGHIKTFEFMTSDYSGWA